MKYKKTGPTHRFTNVNWKQKKRLTEKVDRKVTVHKEVLLKEFLCESKGFHKICFEFAPTTCLQIKLQYYRSRLKVLRYGTTLLNSDFIGSH